MFIGVAIVISGNCILLLDGILQVVLSYRIFVVFLHLFLVVVIIVVVVVVAYS